MLIPHYLEKGRINDVNGLTLLRKIHEFMEDY